MAKGDIVYLGQKYDSDSEPEEKTEGQYSTDQSINQINFITSESIFKRLQNLHKNTCILEAIYHGIIFEN